MSIEQNLLVNLVDQIGATGVLLDEQFSAAELATIRSFKTAASAPNASIPSLLQILPIPVQRLVNEHLNEIIGQLVLCAGTNVKSQLSNAISHMIKRTLANRKEIKNKNGQLLKQTNAMNDLYSKMNTQIQTIDIDQLKMNKALEVNNNQIETIREQCQLLLKQMQLQRCELMRDTYTTESNETLRNMKLDFEEKQQQFDEEIIRLKNLETTIGNEGVHYQQLIKCYYEMCDELVNAKNALVRLKQQQQLS